MGGNKGKQTLADFVYSQLVPTEFKSGPSYVKHTIVVVNTLFSYGSASLWFLYGCIINFFYSYEIHL